VRLRRGKYREEQILKITEFVVGVWRGKEIEK
jgi:hypothetical protein